MGKLKYTVNGFMKDMAYTAYLPGFFNDYEDSFGEAESINVELNEIPMTMIGKTQKKSITFSEDGLKVNIYFSDWREYNSKGKEKSKPTPQSVFESLKNLMNKAVSEYNDQFPNKNENG